MKEADISALLKGSPGRPRTPPDIEHVEIIDGVKVVHKVDWKEWNDGAGRIIVGFVDGRVWHKTTEGNVKPR